MKIQKAVPLCGSFPQYLKRLSSRHTAHHLIKKFKISKKQFLSIKTLKYMNKKIKKSLPAHLQSEERIPSNYVYALPSKITIEQ